MADWRPAMAPRVTDRGTLFQVWSSAAERVFLHLYDAGDDAEPRRTLEAGRRPGNRFEVFVPGAGHGQLYAWAVDPSQPLVDPWALAVAGPARFGDRRGAVRKSVVIDVAPPRDWERPRTPWPDSIVYEVHVRGFTRHPSANVEHPGTYRGLAEKAEYLRDLGVTAVELLPVHEFDETEVDRAPDLYNFWGYSPVAWLAPMRRYAAAAAEPDGPVREFREMVLALHRAGIEVILDVVFNHTAELDATGPTWHFRALDDAAYYLRQPRTGDYADLTGCGNTVRAQHEAVRTLVRDALRWWVHGMGVDGFRFDLAAILCRDVDGKLLAHPPLIEEIERDPMLEGTHLIAEAWDAAGGYLVHEWPGGPRWAVWNDRFRDDVRRAWLDAPKKAPVLATRLCGSSDVFGGHRPPRSLNFVTAHDGFTLRDAVSFSHRHNIANLEGNRDGHGHEVSANHGAEGPTKDPDVSARRERARRNLVASLLLAQGVPMLLAGDERGRTQLGNNNAYCHDSELTWVDWDDDDRDFRRFVRGLVRLRKQHADLRRAAFLDHDDVTWLGPDERPPRWTEGADAFGYRLDGVLVLVNPSAKERHFALPGGPWGVAVNTAAPPPVDYQAPPEPLEGATFTAKPKSLVVLVAT